MNARAGRAVGMAVTVAFAILAGMFGLAPVGARAAAPPLRFSAPVKIVAPPYASAHALAAIDCPATTLCVVGDAAGNILTATDPTAGAGASAWTLASQVSPDAGFTAVSCASATFCVATAADGAVLVSHDPTGGVPAWHRTAHVLPAGDSVKSLACPSAHLCVATDHRGAALSTRTPGAPHRWRSVHLATRRRDGLAAVACPSATECVTVDTQAHTVWHASSPAGGGTAWHPATLPTGSTGSRNPYSADALSCGARGLCAIVGLHQPRDLAASPAPFVATATHPTGSGAAWRLGSLSLKGGGKLDVLTISCPTATFCAVGGGTGAVETTLATSAHPAGGAGTYAQSLYVDDNGGGAPANLGLAGLSCASAGECVATADGGEVAASSEPTGTALADWPVAAIDGYDGLATVACPSATECLAGGSSGALETSTDPASGTAAWTSLVLPTAGDFDEIGGVDQIACAGVSLCVVGEGDGDLAASTTPLTGGYATAQTSGDLPDGGSIAVMSCVTGPFCIAGAAEVQSDSDDEGTSSLSTTDPTGPTDAWDYEEWIEGGVNGGHHPADGDVRSLACASETLCVAGDAKGGILVNMTPSDISSWRYTRADGTAAVAALSCPTSSLCVGVDSQGRVLHASNPVSGPWASATIDRGVPLTALACASTSLCVAVDGVGDAFESTDPTGGASAWREVPHVDRDITSIACPTAQLCVAVDARGNEVTATG